MAKKFKDRKGMNKGKLLEIQNYLIINNIISKNGTLHYFITKYLTYSLRKPIPFLRIRHVLDLNTYFISVKISHSRMTTTEVCLLHIGYLLLMIANWNNMYSLN